MTQLLAIICHEPDGYLSDLEERVHVAAEEMMASIDCDAKHTRIELAKHVVLHVWGTPACCNEKGVAVGHLISGDMWNDPQDELDGCYGIVRMTERGVEALVDGAASVSLFVMSSPSVTVVSTNQMLAISAVGDFSVNPQTLSWFITSGGLGPGQAWDARMHALAPGGSVLIDIDRPGAMTFRRSEFPAFVEEGRGSPALLRAVSSSMKAFEDVISRSALSLSGGLDSRVLLSLLAEQRSDVASFSFSTGGNPHPKSDAALARRLADLANTKHLEFVSPGPRDSISALQQFSICSDGRSDHFSGYLDGFVPWRTLAGRAYQFVIRGDEGFGWVPVVTESDVFISTRMPRPTDLGLPLESSIGLAPLTHPPALLRGPTESISSWRDRAYFEIDLPFVLAALSSTKAWFVDTLNPFLTKRVLNECRNLSDRERNDKHEFRDKVAPRLQKFSEIPFATAPGMGVYDVFSSDQLRHLACNLGPQVPPKLSSYLLHSYRPRASGAGSNWRNTAKNILPPSLRGLLRNARRQYSGPSPPIETLILRAWLASRFIDRATAVTQRRN